MVSSSSLVLSKIFSFGALPFFGCGQYQAFFLVPLMVKSKIVHISYCCYNLFPHSIVSGDLGGIFYESKQILFYKTKWTTKSIS